MDINWLYLLPLILLQLGLFIFALYDILKYKSFKRGSLVIWVLVVCFINIIGPVIYFALGKKYE